MIEKAGFRNNRSACHPLQTFAAVHASIHNHFHQDIPFNRRDILKKKCSVALAEWRVNSRFKCDTELVGEGLEAGLEGEAFSGRGVERPEQGIEVVIAVARQGGVSGDVTA